MGGWRGKSAARSGPLGPKDPQFECFAQNLMGHKKHPTGRQQGEQASRLRDRIAVGRALALQVTNQV